MNNSRDTMNIPDLSVDTNPEWDAFGDDSDDERLRKDPLPKFQQCSVEKQFRKEELIDKRKKTRNKLLNVNRDRIDQRSTSPIESKPPAKPAKFNLSVIQGALAEEKSSERDPNIFGDGKPRDFAGNRIFKKQGAAHAQRIRSEYREANSAPNQPPQMEKTTASHKTVDTAVKDEGEQAAIVHPPVPIPPAATVDGWRHGQNPWSQLNQPMHGMPGGVHNQMNVIQYGRQIPVGTMVGPGLIPQGAYGYPTDGYYHPGPTPHPDELNYRRANMHYLYLTGYEQPFVSQGFNPHGMPYPDMQSAHEIHAHMYPQNNSVPGAIVSFADATDPASLKRWQQYQADTPIPPVASPRLEESADKRKIDSQKMTYAEAASAGAK